MLSSTDNFSVTVPTPGQALVHYSGPALFPSPENPIGYLTATVPAGTAAYPVPYRAADLLHLTNASLNGGRIPTTTSDALHLVAYVGDANGDGAYSSDDAVKITRVMLQADSGFAAYPRVDPVIVADTDGAGFIPADAALQANEAGVGATTNNLPVPPIPHGAVFHAAVQYVNSAPSVAAALQLPVPAASTASSASMKTTPMHVRAINAHQSSSANEPLTAFLPSATPSGLMPVPYSSTSDPETRSVGPWFPSLAANAPMAALPPFTLNDATEYVLAAQRSWPPGKQWQAAADLALLTDPESWRF
jgi:hypothetical protein